MTPFRPDMLSFCDVAVPVTYRSEWPDGFGARGWKLDIALDDPAVIAAASSTGTRIGTSVLVHDILDHYISGFPPSGHRNEAMALIQLQRRTGSDPRPDYEQMVDEDLMHGIVSGESMRSFLPPNLIRFLRAEFVSGSDTIKFLSKTLGRELLRTALVERFFELGHRGVPMAVANWASYGLDYARSNAIGKCLQELLVQADEIFLDGAYSYGKGSFRVGNRVCRLILEQPSKSSLENLVETCS